MDGVLSGFNGLEAGFLHRVRKLGWLGPRTERGNYAWLAQADNFTVLKRRIEFSAAYFVKLLVLLGSGAGWFFSGGNWRCGCLFRTD